MWMKRFLPPLLLLVAACGPATTPAAKVEAPPVTPPPHETAPPELIDSEVDPPPLYLAPAQGAVRQVCSSKATPDLAANPKTKIYDFSAIEVAAVSFGPRIADRPLSGHPRSPGVMAQRIAAAKQDLHMCYRWARWKNRTLKGAMGVALEMDEFGRVTEVTVADAKAWGELTNCVKAVLFGIGGPSLVPRRTRVSTTIQFDSSGQAKATKRPDRPTGRGWGVRPACMEVLVDEPLDELTLAGPVVTVDDFGRANEDRDNYKNRDIGDRDKRLIRASLAYNRGAFSACWAEATARAPAIKGEVTLAADIGNDGAADAVRVDASTAGDPALEECLRVAFAQIRFSPALDLPRTTVHIPFALAKETVSAPTPAARDTVANVEAAAKAALAAGDGATALRRYAALAHHAPSCAYNLGMLRSLLVSRPWIDETVMAAAADFVASEPTPSCRADAAPVLGQLAGWPHSEGLKRVDDELIAVAVERYQLVLRLADLPNANDLRTWEADALIRLGRDAEAQALIPPGATATTPKL